MDLGVTGSSESGWHIKSLGFESIWLKSLG